jgi:hypothetical protein
MRSTSQSWVVGLRWLAAVSLATVAGAAGCGEPGADEPLSLGAQVDPGTTAGATSDGVEVRRAALTNTFGRGYLQAVMAPNGKIMLVWADTKDPATSLPGTLYRPWVMLIDPTTGAQTIAPKTFNTTPSWDTVERSASWVRVAVSMNTSQALLVFHRIYGPSDTDIEAYTLSPNTLTADTAAPFDIQSDSSNDYGAYPAYDPATRTYFVSFERSVIGSQTVERAQNVSLTGAVDFNNPYAVDPLNIVTAGASEGDAVFADGRFISSVDGAISSIIPGTKAVAGSTAVTSPGGAHQRVQFSAATHRVAITTLNSNVNFPAGSTAYLRTYPTATCFPNPTTCQLTKTQLYSTASGNVASTTTSFGSGFLTAIKDPQLPLQLATVVTNQTGVIQTTGFISPTCQIGALGASIETPNGTWVFWWDCSFQLHGMRVNSLGQGTGGEKVIIP